MTFHLQWKTVTLIAALASITEEFNAQSVTGKCLPKQLKDCWNTINRQAKKDTP